MFGIMTDDILKIKSLCKKKKIYLIEDASHAHGAKLNGLYAGNIGDVGCFSLYATELFDKALCGSDIHHCPVFASRILSSVSDEREIRALLLTPPTTTISAILQMIS